MKWRELKEMLTRKLAGEIKPGSDHDKGFARCDGKLVGHVKIGRHGEMKNHEIGGSARQLGVSENQLRQLMACTISHEEFCAMIRGK